ncbi:antibiotic biosynthesis monooxygenase [Vibrio sp.]|uniref:Antibiotic biosynthesis monooxygenase n=1 Tax=Vibrio viridaestus TaxID=2487322 RepID=A0A3N9U3Y0_9VIBR|nr:antibiotic biosynthesis monooxygenase [Vibrio viridaestus]MDC0610388.1 antibiotic biosynthesis monooxygenase [Vibrio sp.]RQW64292.1 antibiotic biosynthesis monooxygenase [Vibrio viridaestus]
MPKVILQGYILVPKNDLAAVHRELPNHKLLTKAEPGCLTFDVTPDSSNFLRFNVYEEFTDREAFEHHQRRVKASVWGEVTSNVERFYKVS